MKLFKFVFLLVLVAGCNSGNTSSDGVEQWLSIEGKAGMPHVVLISGDEEYRSEEALPQLAKILSKRHGFKCTVLFAQNPAHPGVVDSNYTGNIPGLEHLESADLMIISTRFRALPDEQMKFIDDYLKAGKPVLGMRTATHAFNFRGENAGSAYAHYSNGKDEWQGGFGRLVLGEKWIAHHGAHKHQSTKGLIASGAERHPVLNGIEDGDIWGPTDVYEVRLPMLSNVQAIVLGQVVNRAGAFDESDLLYGMRPEDDQLPESSTEENTDGETIETDKNNPMMPVAWTKSYQIPDGKVGRSFTTTMGASTDLLSEGTRRMLVNATFWCLELDVPARASVDVVGAYTPSQFGFKDDNYWKELDLRISSLK